MPDLNVKIRLSGEQERSLAAALRDVQRSIGGLAQAATREGATINRAFAESRRGVESISRQLNQARNQAILFFQIIPRAVRAIGRLGEASDEFVTLNARVRNVSDTTADAATNFQALFDQAQRAGTDLSPVVTLFQGIGRSAKELEASGPQVLAVVRAIQEAGIISGAQGGALSGAVLQLSQMFSGTVVQAQEMNSIIDAMPALVKEIAAGLGLTTGEFIRAAKSGEVLVKDVFDAILKRAPNISAAFADFPDTIARGAARIRNAFLLYVGGANQASGASRALIDSLNGVAENFTSIANAAVGLGAVGIAAVLGRLVGGVAAWTSGLRQAVSAQLAANAAARAGAAQQVISAEAVLLHAQRQVALTTGMARLTATQQILIPAQHAYQAALAASAATTGRLTGLTGALRGSLAVLGGPIGLITTALTLGATAWFVWGRNADEAGKRAKDAIDGAKQAIETVREQQALAAAGVAPLAQPLVAYARRLRDEYAETQTRIAELDRKLKSLGSGFSTRRSGIVSELQAARRRAEELLTWIGKVGEALRDLPDAEESGAKLPPLPFDTKAAEDALKREIEIEQERRRLEDERIDRLGVLRDRLFPLQAAARQFNEELALLKEAGFDEASEAVRRLKQEFAETTGGARKLIDAGKSAMGTLNQFVVQAARNVQSSLADYLFDPLQDGFDGLVDGFADALKRMAAEAAASRILSAVVGADFGSTGQLGGALGRLLESARGNAFDARGRVMAFAQGGIIDRPIVFPFAQGIGLAGEAGAEAIMPLQRDSRGNLGVSAVGAGLIFQVINQGAQVSEPQVTRGPDGREIVRMIVKGVADDVRAGGPTSRAIQQAFGLRRPGINR